MIHIFATENEREICIRPAIDRPNQFCFEIRASREGIRFKDYLTKETAQYLANALIFELKEMEKEQK